MHQRTELFRTSAVALALTAALLAGCADPRNAPGALEPGNSITVAERAIGAGGGGGSRTYDDGATLGAVPHIDYLAPNVPVKVDGQTDFLFFFSQESLDGEAERDEFWVKVTVAEQSFTKAHRHNAKSLLLDAETDIPRSGMIPRSARLKNPQRDSYEGQDMPLPLIKQGQQSTRVTVAAVDPTNGRPTVVGTQDVPHDAGADPQDPNQVQRMIDRFNALQSSRQDGQGAAAATVPSQASPMTAAPGTIDTTPVPRSGTGR
jgi:hypothetical protein